jgi:hypothetical protein
MRKNHRAGSTLSCTSWASDETRISIEAWWMEGETGATRTWSWGSFAEDSLVRCS